jgi:XTP/dITP diphosphohydrolase
MRRLDGNRLLVATHNAGKLEEIIDLFACRDLKIVSAAQLGLPIPEETESTFAGNARIKAHAAAKASGLPALADDSGLCIDALGGLPGVWSADWAETSNGRDFEAAIRRICGLLTEKGPETVRSAQFVCTFALAWPDGHDELFEGRVEGRIVCPGRGTFGHGYDPIFEPIGESQTFGEMDRWKKNRLSHRGRAFKALLECFT